jgi:hypothetical protein
MPKIGGIRPTMDQLALAASAGLPILVSGLADGMLVKTAACQVAVAAGYRGPPCFSTRSASSGFSNIQQS